MEGTLTVCALPSFITQLPIGIRIGCYNANMKSLDTNTDQQIVECVDLLKEVLGEDLLGVFLYGSSIVGGLQRFSDIDIFVVSARQTSYDEKTKLVKKLLTISGVYRSVEKRPIEMIIVVISEVNPWKYPPSFDFQHGDWLRTTFASGNVEPWPSKVRPDLALLITQVQLASKTLYGKEPNQLLAQVPYDDFMTAIVDEMDTLRADLEPDTRNVLLTLARVWKTVETDSISSKEKAANWVIERLPEEFKPVMQRALVTALGEQEEKWDDLEESISQCADYMLDQIKKRIESIKSSDNTAKTITIAE